MYVCNTSNNSQKQRDIVLNRLVSLISIQLYYKSLVHVIVLNVLRKLKRILSQIQRDRIAVRRIKYFVMIFYYYLFIIIDNFYIGCSSMNGKM